MHVAVRLLSFGARVRSTPAASSSLPASARWTFAQPLVALALVTRFSPCELNYPLLAASSLHRQAAHLGRHAHAHLFLDTFYYGAHSTATDALRGGLPVLSTPGTAFARRVGASLLLAAGGRQPLLLTASLAEFENLAVHLAWGHARSRGHLRARGAESRHPPPHLAPQPPGSASVLAQLRAELLPADAKVAGPAGQGAVLAGPLFDTARFTRQAERAYALMWEVHVAGKLPAMHIVVAPLAGA